MLSGVVKTVERRTLIFDSISISKMVLERDIGLQFPFVEMGYRHSMYFNVMELNSNTTYVVLSVRG